MVMESRYCPQCQRHTPHENLVTTYGTVCLKCGHKQSQLDRLQTESQTYTTPDGIEGQLIEDTPETAVFYVGEGQYKGYYHYNKRTGFGAVQELPE